MIINSLTLHNFMSYADARLDLTSVDVACLSGPNGSGKSALLDAITWVLWEAARAPSDELVRLGQQEMWVDLCFSLEGQIYRARRARQKSYGRGGQQTGSKGNLDLQVWDGDERSWHEFFRTESGVSSNQADRTGADRINTDRISADRISADRISADRISADRINTDRISADRINTDRISTARGDPDRINTDQSNTDLTAADRIATATLPLCRGKWRSLTASGMRETQKRLRELLRMDYETFITSVYLRQGKADEFTTRSPNERKQVLSDILGLDYFDRLQERCREQARECKGRIQILEAGLNSRSEFEQGFEKSITDIEQIKNELQQISAQIEASLQQQNEFDTSLAKLNYLQIRAETARARTAELTADLASLDRRADELQQQEKKLKSIVNQSEFIVDQFRQFEQCKQIAESLDIKAAKNNELTSRRLELRSKIAMFQGRMEVELEHLSATLDTRAARKKSLEKNCNEAQKLEAAFQEYRRLLEAELEMSRKRETFTSLSTRADELQSMIAEARVRLEAQIQQQERLLVELDELLSGRHQIDDEYDALKSELDDIDKAESEFEMVEEKGIKVKSQIDSLQQQIVQLKKYIKENEAKMHELCATPDLSSCPLCRSPIVDSKAVLDRYEQDSQNAGADIGDIENQIASLVDERDTLRKRYVELRKRLEERKRIDMKIGEFNARKAAIERAESNRDELKKSIEEGRQALEQQRYAHVERESLIRVKAELSKLEFDPIVFSSFQAQMRAQRQVEVRYQQMQRDLKELDELNGDIPRLKDRITEMELSLKTEKFAPDERAEIQTIESEIAELGYDKFAHQHLKAQLIELMPFAEKSRDLEKAQHELPEVERMSCEISAMIQSRRQEIDRLSQEAQEWLARLDELPSLRMQLEEERARAQQWQLRRDELEKERIILDTRIQQLHQDKLDLDLKRATLSASIKEMGEYNLLAEAFGKKGLQAIIIENAIPEIEAEANRILARLTDNQMHLALLTQQRTRQGNAIETLDIMIADEIGTRSYELYSGGEAFKVNFALRVAMSRLLARRAGARLETLIIDEGFGSQDEYSRTKMVQAIASIKPDFARIIIVTHIAEIKDMFPMQIAVTKEEGISRIVMT